MRLLIIVILLAFPALEIYFTAHVASMLGVPAFILLLASALAGWLLIKEERLVFRQKTLSALRGGQPLMQALMSSGRRLIAGVLLIIPGVVSDLMALVLLALPIRHMGTVAAVKAPGDAIEGECHRID